MAKVGSAVATYRCVSHDEAVRLVDGIKKHAAHVMLYAKLQRKLFGRYNMKYAVLMQMRFDGTLGFPGGMVDKGETPEMAVNREMCEELGCSPDSCVVTTADHVMSQVSYQTQFCLHFYAKEITIETLHSMERSAIVCNDYGSEVMGVVRCPLHTMSDGNGFSAFLQHQFIGNSKQQLLETIKQRGLLTQDEIQAALTPTGTDNKATYQDITRDDAMNLTDHITHASHTILYAPVPGKLFGKYDMKYTVMVQMRFDGTLGFPGGIADWGETPEMALNREMSEELGCDVSKFAITPDDHLFSKVSENLKHGRTYCLHSYAKQISKETLEHIEKCSLEGNDYGLEVLGVIRCPLYTLPNGLGFPAFLKHRYIADSQDQLLYAIKDRKLLTQSELQMALKDSDHINTVVTVDDTDI